MNKKLEVVELNLGIDKISEIPKVDKINEQTVEKIQSKLEQAVEEKQAHERIKEREEQKEAAVEKCYAMLVDSGENGVKVAELLQHYDNLISLVGKLRTIIKKRGNIWDLRKKQRSGETYYYLKPSQLSQPLETGSDTH